MPITFTLSSDAVRERALQVLRTARAGTRVTFEDPEATDAQLVRMRIMLEEVSRCVEWHGRKLTAREWRRMFLAVVRSAEIVPGIEDGTAFILFEKNDTPSVDEASGIIELALKFAAERGLDLGGERRRREGRRAGPAQENEGRAV